MTTSLGDLLDTLVETARRTPDLPRSHADAGAALGQLGRALHGLQADGLQWDLHGDRARHTALLAAACTALAARAPAADEPGAARLTDLAGAAADTVITVHGGRSDGVRWAMVIEISHVIHALSDVLTQRLHTGPAAEWLDEIDTHTLWIGHDASRLPPPPRDLAILDTPLPAHRTTGDPVGHDAASQVIDATATLLQATRHRSPPLSISAVAAATIAAESLAATAHRLRLDSTGAGDAATAARAWAAVRVTLRPLHDGSRGPQPEASTLLDAAARLNQQLRLIAADPDDVTATTRAAVGAAAQQLPAIAANLQTAASAWAASGRVLAFARDLPPREDRITQHLAGYRLAGMITADEVDLAPVADRLDGARLLSTALAACLPAARTVQDRDRTAPATDRDRAAGTAEPASSRTGRDPTAPGPDTRRLAALHRAALEERGTSARLHAAKHAAYQRLHTPPSPGPRYGR